jgi:phage shock protein A
MRFIEFLFLRGVLFVGLPVLLAVLLIGPARVWKSLKKVGYFLFRSRLEPEQILARVVRQHEQHVAQVRKALTQAENTELAIRAQLTEGENQAAALESEAQTLASRGDDLGARGALFKLNLERQAVDNFRRQAERQQSLIADSRKRLFQIELQLRQYELGRSILLSQLAQAKTVEQQYAIAQEFDPFNAISTWREAEGLVHEKAIQAQAIERVYNDIHEPPALEAVDAATLEAQLAELKARLPGQAKPPGSLPPQSTNAAPRSPSTNHH